MADCSEYEILINYLLDGEITPDEQKMLEEHLAECESCREYLREMKEMTAQLGEMELDAPAELLPNVMKAVKAEKSKKKVIRLRYYAAAAAALFVVIAAAAVLPRLKGGNSVKEAAVETAMAGGAGSGYSMAAASTAIPAEGGIVSMDAAETAEAPVNDMPMMFAETPKMAPEPEPSATGAAAKPAESFSAGSAARETPEAASEFVGDDCVAGETEAELIPEIGGREFAMYVFIDETALPESFVEKLETADGEPCYIVSMDEAKRIAGEESCIGVMYLASGEQLAAVIVSK